MPIEKFHGPNVRQKDVEDVQGYFRRHEARVFEMMKKKEVARTEWHDRMIVCAQEILQKECARLGLPNIVGTTPEKYLFLSAEDFAASVPVGDYHTRAFYSNDYRHIVMNVEESRDALFSGALHESIHAISYHDVMLFPEKTTTAYRRLGVEMTPPTQDAHFRGVNEAITERLKWKLCSISKVEIQKTLGFTDEEMHDVKTMRSYTKFIDLLDLINDRIAEETHTTRDACWDTWTKVMFTGEMMSFRQVERVWGEGSLRILSMLGYDKKLDAKVFKFFGTMSHGAAEKIRRELLKV